MVALNQSLIAFRKALPIGGIRQLHSSGAEGVGVHHVQQRSRFGFDLFHKAVVHQNLRLEAVAVGADVKAAHVLRPMGLVAACCGELFLHGGMDSLQQCLGTFIRGGALGFLRNGFCSGYSGGQVVGLAAARQNSGAQHAAEKQRDKFFHNSFFLSGALSHLADGDDAGILGYGLDAPVLFPLLKL